MIEQCPNYINPILAIAGIVIGIGIYQGLKALIYRAPWR